VPVVSSLVSVAYGPTQRDALHLPRWKIEGARALDLLTARLVTRFHAISRVVAVEMGKRLRIAPDRIEVIPRGRDQQDLGVRSADRRARVREALGLDPSVPLIVVASRHEPAKAVDVAVDAFATVLRARPDARLILAGREGAATPQVRAAIERSGGGSSIDVLGFRDDVPDLLAASDVLLFPSRWEGLGSVLIEAMALELPVVASDLPVLRELLVDDDGTELAGFAPVGAPAILAERCLDAFSDQADRVGRAHARYLRLFTSERVGRRLAGLYRTAASR
jgi:glycosyltransferase involved in cell wall biosynthesis